MTNFLITNNNLIFDVDKHQNRRGSRSHHNKIYSHESDGPFFVMAWEKESPRVRRDHNKIGTHLRNSM